MAFVCRPKRRGQAPIDAAPADILLQFRNYQSGIAMAICAHASRGARFTRCTNSRGAARNLQAHYNIAPTDTVEVARPAGNGATELAPMRRGLIPSWWTKPLKQLPATFPWA